MSEWSDEIHVTELKHKPVFREYRILRLAGTILVRHHPLTPTD